MRTLLSRSYVPSLDGIRGLAVLAVFAFHAEDRMTIAPEIGWLAKRGWYGVDVFFALSGFLITWMLLRERERTGHIAVGRFYARRILRLWPAYLVVLAVTYLALFTKGTSQERLHAMSALPFLLTYTSNFAAAAGFLFPLTLHYWSLAVEEQYYALYPLLLRKLSVSRLAVVLSGLVLAIAGTRALGFFYWPFSWPPGGHLSPVVFYVTPLRIDGILMGALAATSLHLPQVLRWLEDHVLRSDRLAFACFLWLLLVVLFAEEGDRWVYIVWLPLMNALCALVILATFLGRPAAVCRFLEQQWLVWVGRVSYGIYLVHVLVLSAVNRVVRIGRLAPWPAHAMSVAGALVITLLAAFLMHQFVEAPFLELKRRFT